MAAHHPAVNGLVERFHLALRVAFLCYADPLPLVLFGICTAFKEDVQASLTELMY
jgi:hypothetical protein